MKELETPPTEKNLLGGEKQSSKMIGHWHVPVTIAPNNFVRKSLSNWALNPAVGCGHACRFCYVPSVSAIKLGPILAEHGVMDADAEWGQYSLVRPWDEQKFLASLRRAENTPRAELTKDGNRAVFVSSTTDAYQTIYHPDPIRRRKLTEQLRFTVRRSLELIRDHSTLNLRILTRSPLAREDFDLFRSFGRRLLFGMSLPTLRNDLAKVYEPKAPAPSQRLATLRSAKEAGLHVYAAVAPTYPESGETDLRATLSAVAELDPVTVFHEPINIRSENVARIATQATAVGVKLDTEVFSTPQRWRQYAVHSLKAVERIATELKVVDRLHLWPDSALESAAALRDVPDPVEHRKWLYRYWNRVSEWPR